MNLIHLKQGPRVADIFKHQLQWSGDEVLKTPQHRRRSTEEGRHHAGGIVVVDQEWEQERHKADEATGEEARV